MHFDRHTFIDWQIDRPDNSISKLCFRWQVGYYFNRVDHWIMIGFIK